MPLSPEPQAPKTLQRLSLNIHPTTSLFHFHDPPIRRPTTYHTIDHIFRRCDFLSPPPIVLFKATNERQRLWTTQSHLKLTTDGIVVRGRGQCRARCSNREGDLKFPGRYRLEPRNQRYHSQQDSATKRGHAQPETTNRQQEPECAARHIEPDGYLCQEWRITFHGRDCEQRVHRQLDEPPQGIRSG